ncbi:MAG TPA: Uma2 family endonuclease [Blastocatellia bacterium]|nr:Uma2 family endonuclease [Blastocatellia bacterium]
MTALPRYKYTLDEYLELDAKSEARLEYWDGEVFDMSGGSDNHDQIEGNVFSYLKLRTKERRCLIFTGNMRIRVPSMPPYRYGDTSALCGQPQFVKMGGVDVLTNPALIIEVLFDSTESYDRGDKFTNYKSIPSFVEYLLIAQHRPHVSQYIRQTDGSWLQYEFNDLAEVVRLTSVGSELSLQEIYENVTFDASARNPHLRPLE